MCVSVRTFVRTYVREKFFSYFHLIWCVGRPRPHMRTNVTSIRSKVTVKVTELPKLRKLHFPTSISSAVLPWSSKLMADRLIVIVWDLVYSLSEPDFRISFYESYHDSSNSPNVDISRNSNGHISVLRDATVTRLGKLVALHVLCMLI